MFKDNKALLDAILLEICDIDDRISETNAKIKKYRGMIRDEDCAYMLESNKKTLKRELQYRTHLYSQRAKMRKCAASLQARVEELA